MERNDYPFSLDCLVAVNAGTFVMGGWTPDWLGVCRRVGRFLPLHYKVS